jgi:DNA-binding MarR family transcriptional regulator
MIDPLDGLLGYQLRRASVVMMADLSSALEPLGLRPTEASVLLAIRANPRATLSGLCRLLGVQRANMTPMVAALAARGFVDRSAGDDGRSHAVALSREGMAMAGRAADAIAAHEARHLPTLSVADRERLIATLRAVREAS